mmetsp:Transcript_29178/g.57137  ORF Transcript_29178/g.57137 Transcript_29178/m.57137 type:complete len:147 (+) Transcript_29178:104-544(+)
MQSFIAALCVLALCSTALAGLEHRDSPEEIDLDLEFRHKDSFGNSVLTPPCENIQCGAYSCPAPFELKKNGACCGYCWAPDHEVPLDRHMVTAYNASGSAVELCDTAPASCRGPGASRVRCFIPSCREGEETHCVAGACCSTCTTR